MLCLVIQNHTDGTLNLFVVLLILAPLSQKLEPPANPGRFTVERNEFHGETRLISLKNGRHEINISVAADTCPAIGEVLGVDVASSDIHVFDPDTGLRLN